MRQAPLSPFLRQTKTIVIICPELSCARPHAMCFTDIDSCDGSVTLGHSCDDHSHFVVEENEAQRGEVYSPGPMGGKEGTFQTQRGSGALTLNHMFSGLEVSEAEGPTKLMWPVSASPV